MSVNLPNSCTVFCGHHLLLSGALAEVALAAKAALNAGSQDAILVFDDVTAHLVELDLRGTDSEIVERLSRPNPVSSASAPEKTAETRGRGRPKLGVVSREVTLLPGQWEWLNRQPGGASAVLRRLVEDARRNGSSQHQRRAAQEIAYRFMHAIAGDLPEYEEATRALFADDRARLEQQMARWPKDIRAYALRLAFGAGDGQSS